MPRFAHPLTWQLTNVDGDAPGPMRISMRARVMAEVEDRTGTWRAIQFVIDTGASFPIMRTGLAEALRLEVPHEASPISFTTADGRRASVVRDGELHLRFPQLLGQTFRLKCLFRDNQPAGVPPVLGLHNTLDLLGIRFDGTTMPSAGPAHPEDGFMGYVEFTTRDGST